MARYKIWDKAEDIYTLGAVDGRSHWTAEEYIAQFAPWAANPAVQVIVGGGAINGTVFMELGATAEHYRRLGAAITDGMSDAEILAAIEEFEDNPPAADPSAEERIAAALEYQVLAALPDEEVGA